jgi:hypothetical protein
MRTFCHVIGNDCFSIREKHQWASERKGVIERLIRYCFRRQLLTEYGFRHRFLYSLKSTLWNADHLHLLHLNRTRNCTELQNMHLLDEFENNSSSCIS